MGQKMTKYLGVVLLVAASHLSFGQYFQSLFDVDSTFDWGWCIQNASDSNYFILGWSYNQTTGQYFTYDMTISENGMNILNKNEIKQNRVIYAPGNAGELTHLSNDGYIAPLNVGWPDTTTSYLYHAGGIIKLTTAGDTVFTKTYTDTSIHYDEIYSCAVMPDGGYLLGGAQGLNTPSYYPGYLVRTDSAGDTLWTHTYQFFDTQEVTINNVIPLADGRIIIGATSSYQQYISGSFITHTSPWLLELDSIGNILKDTLYRNIYMVAVVGNGAGEIYNDRNGGYILIGAYDSIFTTRPADISEAQNFPAYIAHLDTNFRITWVTEFPYSDELGHRQGGVVRQLYDSSYIIVGDDWTNNNIYDQGFAAKISRTGEIIWSHNYYSDSTQNAYLRDIVQTPEGNLVFVGATFNDTLPSWHQNRDLWLVGTDSNGCEMPGGCGNGLSTGVPAAPAISNGEAKIFPNPTSGNFTINCPQEGAAMIYNIEGQCVATYNIKAGATSLQLPISISPGMYICKYLPDGNGEPVTVRLVYQP